MATEVSQPFYDKLRKHFEIGIKWQDMNFTDEQKRRLEVCFDAYQRFASDPFMDLDTYIRNRWDRTYSELRNDLKVIEFITSFYEEGQRKRTTHQVREASRLLMKNGAETGNMKALADGANLAYKLERLDQPENPDDIEENMAKLPILVVTDVSKKYKNKKYHTPEEMERVRKRWGVKPDMWQDMVQQHNGEYVPAGYEEEEEIREGQETEEEQSMGFPEEEEEEE